MVGGQKERGSDRYGVNSKKRSKKECERSSGRGEEAKVRGGK